MPKRKDNQDDPELLEMPEVRKLYGLTAEEIQLVEDSIK
jgi:hypothetical protein